MAQPNGNEQYFGFTLEHVTIVGSVLFLLSSSCIRMHNSFLCLFQYNTEVKVHFQGMQGKCDFVHVVGISDRVATHKCITTCKIKSDQPVKLHKNPNCNLVVKFQSMYIIYYVRLAT